MTQEEKFQAIFVLFLVVASSWLFFIIIWPFFQALLFGAIFAGLCQPIYQPLVKALGGRKSTAATITLLLLVLIILGPLSTVSSLVVKQAIDVSNQAIPWVQTTLGSQFDIHKWLIQRIPWAAEFIPAKEEIINHIGEVAKATGSYMLVSLKEVTTGTAGIVIRIFVMLYATFYFLRDGHQTLERILYYAPLSNEHANLMINRFTSVTKATIKGTILIGIIQGILAGIGFQLAGVHGAAFWGTLVILLSVIPGGGTLVWVPTVLYVFMSGHTTSAILLAAWCAGVVSTIDNFLRPIWVGKDAQMSNLLILLGTLGGIYLFGPFGFIVGPVICGLFLTIWEIYGLVFKHVLPTHKP